MTADTAVEQIEYSGDAEELLPTSTFSNILSIPIKGGLGKLHYWHTTWYIKTNHSTGRRQTRYHYKAYQIHQANR
jgi:hypothetical protein